MHLHLHKHLHCPYTLHTTHWTLHTAHYAFIRIFAHLSLHTTNIKNLRVGLKIYMAKCALIYWLYIKTKTICTYLLVKVYFQATGRSQVVFIYSLGNPQRAKANKVKTLQEWPCTKPQLPGGRASKSWRRADARLRKIFENPRKMWIFKRKTGKTSTFCMIFAQFDKLL